jgi:dihydroorotate dehydrogenase electron transfer subunit
VTTTAAKTHRNTIELEAGTISRRTTFEQGQIELRLVAPKVAQSAASGSFVHLKCDSALPMRRPMSIMRASPAEGWIDVLFKVVGAGSKALAEQPVGARISILGPIGRGFVPLESHPIRLLLGGGVGIPPMVFLSEELLTEARPPALVVMGSEVPFPFEPGRTTDSIAGIKHTVDATMPLMDEWAIPSRLASLQGYDGTFNGYVTALAESWLDALPPEDLSRVSIYSCGPTPMLRSVAALAQARGIPCQVSLEEFMACAVGGCAGCAVRVTVNGHSAMQRVCVDGPVFDASVVQWWAIPG